MNDIFRPLLLNPGPVTLSQRVRDSLLQADLCHREPEFFALQDEIRRRLLEVYALDASRWAAVLLSGSGTAAVEAMLSTLIPAEGRLLVIENGVYGERMHRIASIYGIACEALPHAWGEAIDLDAVAARLQDTALPRITHVAAVHHETTTGRLNRLAAVAAVCAEHDVALLVDGVSSFGAEAIDFEHSGITAVAATANKCLHGIPGAGFVVTRRDALVTAHPRNLYLDLASWCKAQDAQGTPFTPAVQAYYALREALREFADAGGRAARYAHYRSLADQVGDGLLKLGIEPLLPREQSSVVLRAYRLPPGLDYARLHDGLKACGFVIYAGQGPLAADIFRISTMGAVTADDMDKLLSEIRRLYSDG